MYKRIVVTLDGSDFAEEALGHAVELAKLSTVPIHLVRVSGAHSLERAIAAGAATDYVAMGELIQDEIDESKKYISAKSDELSSQGLKATGTVLTGQVGDAIIGQLQPGDLLAIASHGRTGLSRWFLGSVAEDLVRRATVPVLLIRNSSKDSDARSQE